MALFSGPIGLRKGNQLEFFFEYKKIKKGKNLCIEDFYPRLFAFFHTFVCVYVCVPCSYNSNRQDNTHRHTENIIKKK